MQAKLLVPALAVLLSVAAGAVSAKSYMVIAKEERIPPGLQAAVEAAGGSLVRTIPQIGMAVAESSDKDFAAKLEKAASGIRSVVPDLRVQWIDPGWVTAGDPVDYDVGDLSGYQWGLNAIDAYGAWDAGVLGDGVVVAVVDSGIDYTHPDLRDNYIDSGWDFINNDDDPFDDFFHGTWVAGIIAAADDGEGVIGVAPHAKLMAVKVLGDDGWGTFSSVVSGIVYAADHGANVINMSLGVPGGFPRKGFFDVDGTWVSARDVAEQMIGCNRATGYAHKAGVTTIVAAGNEGIDMDHDTNLFIFAQINHVIVVSATAPEMWAWDPSTDLDVPASYTCCGQSSIHVAAPGGDDDMWWVYPEEDWWYDMVLGCDVTWWPDGWGYFWGCGTSAATPHAAGVAALLISRNGGSMHPDQVKTILQGSADDLGKPGRDDFYGYGRVNAYKAVTR